MTSEPFLTRSSFGRWTRPETHSGAAGSPLGDTLSRTGVIRGTTPARKSRSILSLSRLAGPESLVGCFTGIREISSIRTGPSGVKVARPRRSRRAHLARHVRETVCGLGSLVFSHPRGSRILHPRCVSLTSSLSPGRAGTWLWGPSSMREHPWGPSKKGCAPYASRGGGSRRGESPGEPSGPPG